MTKLLPGLALILATFGCGGDDDDDSGGTVIDATPSGSDAATSAADAAPAADGGADANVGAFAVQLVRPACAPNDAPAIRVLLGTAAEGGDCTLDEDEERVEFEVWTREFEAPALFAFAPGEETAAGQMCPGGGDPCRTYDTGQIQFDTYQDGGAATGTWTLIEGDVSIDGEFTATWCEPAVPEPCG